MYEFFFSQILIKAMQVPFLDHAFMIGYFGKLQAISRLYYISAIKKS